MFTQIKSTKLYTKEPDPEIDKQRKKIIKNRIVESIMGFSANFVLKDFLKFAETDKDINSTLYMLHEDDVTYIVEVFTRLILGKSFVLKPSERENIIKIFNIKPSEQ